ncbi:MAG: hypothetical protein ACOC4S_00215 [Balneolaceae bacterium]
MSEQNQHNNQDPIEELFRKKAAEYDISYNEADWQQLEKRLDARDQLNASRRRQRWAMAAALVIASLLGYFIYQNHQTIDELRALLDEENQPTTEQPVPEETPEESNHTTDEPENESASGPEDPLITLYTDQGEVIPPNQLPEQSQPDESSPRMQAISAERGRNLFIHDIACTDCQVAVPFSAELFSPPSFPLAKVTGSPPIRSVPDPAESGEPLALYAGAEAGEPRAALSRLAIGIGASPDLSTAGSISNFDDPGYRLGIKGEYRLTPKLSISFGVVQSDVRYKAGADQYRPPDGYWTGGVSPQQTFAKCLILDLPIGLKYDFLQFGRSGLFATAGLSSYIMLNEEYRFSYNREETYGLQESWNDHTGTRHWLSNAGFTIGYEFALSPKVSLRAEPYVSLPLKDVGWGNVELYSVGTFFSVNYNL